jgi:DNA-binding winged helix-turn-helix (wHTH) protein/tetratricopeptide (TPR) repeat protein
MKKRYRFDTFEVMVVERQIRTLAGELVPLGSRAFDVLLLLLERRGTTVSKKEILAAVWPGLAVEQSNVHVQISLLRARLGAQLVATVPGKGYRLSSEPVASPAPQDLLALDSPDGRRIAVLQFRSADGAPDHPILARGIARDLVSELSRNSDLRVVAHHSSFAFVTGAMALRDIGARLRTRYLVDGVIDCTGGNLNIHVELLDAVDERVIWVFQQMLSNSDLVKVRDALVRKIGGVVSTHSQHIESLRAMNQLSPPPDVYGQLWKASALLTQFTANGTKDARALLEKAVQMHPDHSPAWAWLGYLNSLDAFMRITGEWHPGRSREYMAQAAKALALDPGNATACRALSIGYRANRNFDAALDAAQRGVEMAPSNAQCLHMLAEAHCALGDASAALISIESALDLYPCPPAWVYAGYGCALWANARLPEALAAANSGLAELPHYWPARLVRLYTLHELGRKRSASREASIIRSQVPRLTTTGVVNYWQDSAEDLRARALDGALSSGIPRGRCLMRARDCQ